MTFFQDCQDTHVSDKSLYPNFARTNPQHIKAALKLPLLLETRGLNSVSIVCQESPKFLVFLRQLIRLLKRRGVVIAGTHKIGVATFHFGVPDFIYTLPSESQGRFLKVLNLIFLVTMAASLKILSYLPTTFFRPAVIFICGS